MTDKAFLRIAVSLVVTFGGSGGIVNYGSNCESFGDESGPVGSQPSALTQKKKAKERILPFVTRYHPAVNNLKQTLMEQWSLIQNQPLLKTIFLKPPIISYKRG